MNFVQDHPRLRGEQRAVINEEFQDIGSPPLARGTANNTVLMAWTLGITPACAGNSYSCYIHKRRIRDHPRLRGEQFFLPIKPFNTAGSPPLARGTGDYDEDDLLELGITPACAGNSI